MAPAPIGFGIVGAGMIGRFHAAAISAIEDARVVAVCDVAPDRARGLAEEFGAATSGSVEELASRPDVDLVVVGTPSGLHLDAALPVLAARKHVIVEKPIEVTLERADAMIAAADEAGVVLSVVSQKRFEEGARTLKRAVDEEAFGRIAFADAVVKWWRSPDYYATGVWRGTRRLDGGGALMNQAIHTVDLIRWIMGPVRSVSGRIARRVHDMECEDTAAAVVEYACGALGVIEASTSAYPGQSAAIAVTGENGSARLEDGLLREWRFRGREHEEAAVLAGQVAVSGSGSGAAADMTAKGHELQFRDVIGAIRSRRRPLVEGRDGRNALELVLAVYESSEAGQPVVPGPPGH